MTTPIYADRRPPTGCLRWFLAGAAIGVALSLWHTQDGPR